MPQFFEQRAAQHLVSARRARVQLQPGALKVLNLQPQWTVVKLVREGFVG